MAGHTPTPWERYGALIFRGGEGGANVCAVCEPRASRLVQYDRPKLGSRDRAETDANAELILRAVNSHEELVAACKEALSLLGSVMEPTVEDEDRVYEALEAAIKKAEGGC